eukprot:CAMPEP_0168551448 /NCGR_PEP_ID=MMETSP0413-20121227/6178_1 /TAXON_ID=136452 /ORGANISM="Filamoeba nolandi, Strain NC-AS-23-1" /LENGTH=124 /DNA_ID=CAMNT_0008581975 /DNA_START=58 /DNA_END=432 /DNA_ORIENTATION=+
MPGRVRAHELRTKSKAELLKQLEDLRNELAQLRVAKVTGGAPSKLAKIRTVRKSIARVLTVISQTQRAALRKHYAKSRHQPLDLRPKFTRALRRQMTPYEQSRKTARERKAASAFPQRVFAVKA